jgi:hypothetical protein
MNLRSFKIYHFYTVMPNLFRHLIGKVTFIQAIQLVSSRNKFGMTYWINKINDN